MPVRFPAYRMRDGVTPLAEDYFNPLLSDIDARIAQLEDQRASLQGVIDELTAFGLQRIDVLIGPAMSAVNAMLDELTQRRDELLSAIGNVGNLATQAQLDAAIAAEQAARQAAIAAEQTARQAAIATEQAARQAAIAAINDAIAQPSAATYAYDAQGRVSSASETLPSGTRTTAYTYDAQGRVSQTVETYAGVTRTTTYTYDSNGALTGYTVTEA